MWLVRARFEALQSSGIVLWHVGQEAEAEVEVERVPAAFPRCVGRLRVYSPPPFLGGSCVREREQGRMVDA